MKSILSQPRAAWFARLIAIGLAAVWLAALPHSGYSAPAAATRYVAPGGNDGGDCLTPLTACEHIQAAIDKSASGDVVSIAAGTYNENVEIDDKDLTLQGQGAAVTIIDGQQAGTVLNIFASGSAARAITVSGRSGGR